jgi:hypothetical protein
MIWGVMGNSQVLIFHLTAAAFSFQVHTQARCIHCSHLNVASVCHE